MKARVKIQNGQIFYEKYGKARWFYFIIQTYSRHILMKDTYRNNAKL